MRLPKVSDWRVFSAFVVIAALLILSELSLFSSSTAGFTSEAMAQSLLAYGRRPDNLEVTISGLFFLSLIAAGLMFAYRRPVFTFGFLTTIFVHNGLSFYASSAVTQTLPSIFAEFTSFGFLMFMILSIVFFELSQSVKNEALVVVKSSEPNDMPLGKIKDRNRFARFDLFRTVTELVIVSIIVGLIVTFASSLSSPNVSFPRPLLDVGSNIGGTLRLVAGIFGAFVLVTILLRFLVPKAIRWFFPKVQDRPRQTNRLETIRRKELVKDLANLFYLQKQLKYFVRRTPVLIVIPKRRDITLILLPLLALVGAYASIGIIFSLGLFSGQVESLRIGYQNSIIPFDSSLYDFEQNLNVSDNVFSAGAEVVGVAINDFLVEVASAVDAFFRAAVV